MQIDQVWASKRSVRPGEQIDIIALLSGENGAELTKKLNDLKQGKGDPSTTGEDDAGDVDTFALFMRCMKAPPRGPITSQVTAGQSTFNPRPTTIAGRSASARIPASLRSSTSRSLGHLRPGRKPA